MTEPEVQALVLAAVENINLTRPPEARLEVSTVAPLFGADSALDSLGLVSLLIDIEEALEAQGLPLTLSDARAMSRTRSPFRNVQSLVAYILESATASA